MEKHADVRVGEDRSKDGEFVGAADFKRIDQPAFLARCDLQQADLVEVVIEAVGFGIEGDDVLFEKQLCEGFEILDRRNDFGVGGQGFALTNDLCG